MAKRQIIKPIKGATFKKLVEAATKNVVFGDKEQPEKKSKKSSSQQKSKTSKTKSAKKKRSG